MPEKLEASCIRYSKMKRNSGNISAEHVKRLVVSASGKVTNSQNSLSKWGDHVLWIASTIALGKNPKYIH